MDLIEAAAGGESVGARRGLLRILSGAHPLALLGERRKDKTSLSYDMRGVCRISVSDVCLQLSASGRAQVVAIAPRCFCKVCAFDVWHLCGTHVLYLLRSRNICGRAGYRRWRII